MPNSVADPTSASAAALPGSPPGDEPSIEGAVPSLSAAEALAGTPFFGELSPVDLARIVPDLEEYHVAPGEAVYRQGDAGDGLYLIRAGSARISMGADAGAETVLALQAPDHFGESALLTGEPRSGTVTAITPLTVWKLGRERFDALVRDYPNLAVHLARELAVRLADANRRLSDTQQQVATVARAAYGVLDPSAQALLRRIAVFSRFDVPLLRATLGAGWTEVPFERLVEEAAFFSAAEPEGWFGFIQESVRLVLVRQLRAEVGERGLTELRRRAADALLARTDADPADALDLVREAEDWRWLGRLLDEHGSALAARDPVRVEGYLRALPSRQLWETPEHVRLLAGCCTAQGKMEQAIETFREAAQRDERARRGPLAVEYQQALADLYRDVGDEGGSLACLSQAMALGGEFVDCATPASSLTDVPDGVEPRERGVVTRWGQRLSLGRIARFGRESVSTRSRLAIGILAVTVAAWFVPAPSGLGTDGLHVLLLIGAMVAMGFVEIVPNSLLALAMIAVWVGTDALPADVAAAGFASSTWFLLLASMAIGGAVARSGLLYRCAVELVRRLPASHRVRCVTLGAVGMLLSPGMPDPAGRLLLAAPLAQDISDTLRYRDRSGGSAGLGLATFIGFGMMGALFLTGSSGALLAYGMLPSDTRAEMSWVRWFIAAVPTSVVLFGLSIGFIILRYRPEGSDNLPEATLALQRRVLGPVSPDERSALGVLVALLVGFSTQSIHGVAPAWIAIGAVVVLYLLGTLDDDTIRRSIGVDFLLYVGLLLSLGPIFTHVGLDRWLSERLTSVTGMVGGSAMACLLLVAAMAALTGLALRPNPIALLLGVALFPTAASAGIDPWVVMFTVMLANNLWLYPQQNVLYQTAYYGTGERAFSHEQARPFALVYPAFVLVAILVSIPYWRWLGLIG